MNPRMTKEFVLQRLEQYYEAEQKILSAGEYRMAGRYLKRADLSEVRKAIQDLEYKLTALEAGRNPNAPRMVRVVPRDL